MAELKTKVSRASVSAFIAAINDESVRKDCRTLIKIMKSVTKEEPKMWGSSIIGFGSYHYKYASGHEGDMCRIGFSPRTSALSIYGCGSIDQKSDAFARLGKHKTGKGCLYITRLSDVDLDQLTKIIAAAYRNLS